MENERYYYNKNGKNNGPVSLDGLKELALKGEINGKTPVIKVGTIEWTRWETLTPTPVGQGANQTMGTAAPKRMKTVVIQATSDAYTSATAQAAQPLQQGDTEQGLCLKITQMYEKINKLLMRICVVPKGVTDSPEQLEKSLSSLNAPVGVSALLCVVCFIMGSGIYKIIEVTAVILFAGCVVQYIVYQVYRAMSHLLLGQKIKLSSMGVPWAVMGMSIVPVVLSILAMLKQNDSGGLMLSIVSILYFAGVTYMCVNAQKLFVSVVPHEVTPGRELINYARFIIRVLFMALHVLTPLLMLICAIALLVNGPNLSAIKFWGAGITKFLLSQLPLSGIILPIVTLVVFCLLSLLPDIAEAIFAAGDAKDKTRE